MIRTPLGPTVATPAAMVFVQNCYVVPDLESACRYFNKAFGIGPFIGGAEFELSDHVYRGEPSEPMVLRGVFSQSGDLNIEIVELGSDGPSAFRDMFPGKQQGLHHVATYCQDYDDVRDHLVSAGMPVASEFETPFGAKICYIDARDHLGHMIELYPENEIIREMYQRTRFETERWSGRDLIIPW
jgi:hypothetical protein